MTIILCIEDEPLVREDIVEALEDRGYEVLEAGDGTFACIGGRNLKKPIYANGRGGRRLTTRFGSESCHK